jgi:hypothetical protein
MSTTEELFRPVHEIIQVARVLYRSMDDEKNVEALLKDAYLAHTLGQGNNPNDVNLALKAAWDKANR